MRSLRAALRLTSIVWLMMSLCLTVTCIAFVWRSERQHRRKLQFILRAMQTHLAWIAAVAGLKLEVRGDPAWPKESFLLIANHVSYWDIVAISALCPTAFVAKSEIARWPLVGFLVSQCQTLFVERNTGEGRLRGLLDLRRRLAHCPVCIFPEGTTSVRTSPVWEQWYRGQISVLKNPGVRVLTLALHYEDQDQCAWVDDDALIPHLWRCLLRSEMKLKIQVQELEASVAAGARLGPYARLAFEQTAALCQELSSRGGRETSPIGASVANFSIASRLTQK